MTFRRAVLADRTWMRSMLVTKVAGVSPYDEIVADFGTPAWSITAADIITLIGRGDIQVVVAFDGAIPRGFNIFLHIDNLTSEGVPDVLDAWQSLYTVTDKTLTLPNRLLVFRGMIRAALGTLAPGTYLWGDVKQGGNLSGLMAPNFQRIAVTQNGVACWRYYGTASSGLAVL